MFGHGLIVPMSSTVLAIKQSYKGLIYLARRTWVTNASLDYFDLSVAGSRDFFTDSDVGGTEGT